MSINKKRSVAVIGGGISGIVASYYLSKSLDVTLFEKNNYVGGHTNTVVIPSGPDRGLAVDTGFIVCNDKTYPEFHKFLRDLGVPVRSTDMSFGYHNQKNNFQYAGTSLRGLFAQPGNLFSVSYLLMLKEILSFNKIALRALKEGELEGLSLGEFLQGKKPSARLLEDYLLPMGAAIWSSPDIDLLSFPAETFFTFFRNHGLLEFRKRPQWQTVIGGSFQYVKSFQKKFSGNIHTDSEVISISRDSEGVKVETQNQVSNFDYCILATHADEALKVLSDPTPEEQQALSPWTYQTNITVLHTDKRFLPPLKSAWAAWNYRREAGADGVDPVSVTYYMNRLQGFDVSEEYCVTLNPGSSIDQSKIIAQFNYTHPVFTFEALQGRKLLESLSGQKKTFFCGSYFGFGFHEDAVKSALRLIEMLGEDIES